MLNLILLKAKTNTRNLNITAQARHSTGITVECYGTDYSTRVPNASSDRTDGVLTIQKLAAYIVAQVELYGTYPYTSFLPTG